MRINATAQGKSDLRDACGNLKLRSDGIDEAYLLSALYLAMSQGGIVRVERHGEQVIATEFRGPGLSPREAP